MSGNQGRCAGRADGGDGVRAAVTGTMALLVAALAACASTPTPIVTSVGKSVATFERFEGMAGCSAVPAPDPQAWWAAVPTANRRYPFAGWKTFRNLTGGCANTNVDMYRAVTTFDLASVSNLKGLVQKAELIVSTRALPPDVGRTLTVTIAGQTGTVVLRCPAQLGGAGALVRFGPNAPVPVTTTAGDFTMLGPDPFPSGTNVVYTLPAIFTAGTLANATSPTTISPTGDGRTLITTDVTGAVTAALNADATGMTWMLTSQFEGLLPGQLPDGGSADCITSYDFELRITHY